MKILHDPGYRAELEKRLAALRPDRPRKWGTMSVDQMLWHVNTTLQLHLGEITAPRERTPLPRRVYEVSRLEPSLAEGSSESSRVAFLLVEETASRKRHNEIRGSAGGGTHGQRAMWFVC